MPIYVFMSLAATLESQKLLFAVQNRRLRNGIGGILALAALPFFGAGAQTAINAAHKPSGLMRAKGVDLTAWLLTHHFSYGLSDYYASQMIINLSRGQIRTSPVNVWGGKLTLYRWNGDTSLWNQTQSPQFFVISPDSSAYGITADTVYASYGTPQKIYHVGSYTVEQFISP